MKLKNVYHKQPKTLKIPRSEGAVKLLLCRFKTQSRPCNGKKEVLFSFLFTGELVVLVTCLPLWVQVGGVKREEREKSETVSRGIYTLSTPASSEHKFVNSDTFMIRS